MLHEGYEFKKKLWVKRNEVAEVDEEPEFVEVEEDPSIEDGNTEDLSAINIPNQNPMSQA